MHKQAVEASTAVQGLLSQETKRVEALTRERDRQATEIADLKAKLEKGLGFSLLDSWTVKFAQDLSQHIRKTEREMRLQHEILERKREASHVPQPHPFMPIGAPTIQLVISYTPESQQFAEFIKLVGQVAGYSVEFAPPRPPSPPHLNADTPSPQVQAPVRPDYVVVRYPEAKVAVEQIPPPRPVGRTAMAPQAELGLEITTLVDGLAEDILKVFRLCVGTPESAKRSTSIESIPGRAPTRTTIFIDLNKVAGCKSFRVP